MEAPKIPTLFGFKSKTPNQFYFEPRYYNERKEKMKQRYAIIEKELSKEKNPTSNPEEFRSSIRNNWGNGYARRKAGAGINARVYVYLIVLFAIAFFILK